MTIALNKKRITLYILLIVAIFLYMPPLIIAVDPRHNFLYKLIRSSAGVVSIIQIILSFFKRRVSDKIYPYMIGIFLCIIEIANLHYGYSFKKTDSYVIDALNILGISCMIFNMYASNRINYFLNSFITYTSILALSNVLTQIFNYRYGLYHNFKLSWQAYYLCGNPNSFVFFYIITLAVIYATAYKYGIYGLKIYGYFVNACMFYSAAIGKSTTGSVCVLAFLILNIIVDTRIIYFLSKHSSAFFVIFAFFVFWFIGLRGWNMETLKEFVSNTVHEKKNLLTRGEIWDFAIKMIKKRPWQGYGSVNPQLSYCASAGIKRSAHNTFLQILLYGGIPAFAMYLALLFIVVIKASFCFNKWSVEYLSAFFIYLVSFLFEQNPFYVGFYVLLVLMFLESSDRKAEMVKFQGEQSVE